MDHEQVIALAREAHKQLVTVDYPGHAGQLDPWTMQLLERFAALIEEHLTYSTTHSYHPGCTKPACVAMRNAVLAERAKVIQEIEDAKKDAANR